MLIAAFGVEYFVRRESRKRAEEYLRMILLQAGAVICPIMGVIRAPDIYPEQVVDMWISQWASFADGLAAQCAFVQTELDLDTRDALATLESRMRSTGQNTKGRLLIEGNPINVGWVLHTYAIYRNIWQAFYPKARMTVIPSGDQLMAEVEARLGIKYEDLPRMELS